MFCYDTLHMSGRPHKGLPLYLPGDPIRVSPYNMEPTRASSYIMGNSIRVSPYTFLGDPIRVSPYMFRA